MITRRKQGRERCYEEFVFANECGIWPLFKARWGDNGAVIPGLSARSRRTRAVTDYTKEQSYLTTCLQSWIDNFTSSCLSSWSLLCFCEARACGWSAPAAHRPLVDVAVFFFVTTHQLPMSAYLFYHYSTLLVRLNLHIPLRAVDHIKVRLIIPVHLSTWWNLFKLSSFPDGFDLDESCLDWPQASLYTSQ